MSDGLQPPIDMSKIDVSKLETAGQTMTFTNKENLAILLVTPEGRFVWCDNPLNQILKLSDIPLRQVLLGLLFAVQNGFSE